MITARAASIGSTSIVGLASLSLYSVHEFTKETIWRQIHEDAILTGNGSPAKADVWIEQVKKLSNLNEIKDPELKKIKDLQEESTKGEELKRWCSSSYRRIYRSKIKMGDGDWIKEIRIACVKTIGEWLGTNKIETNDNSSNGNDELLKKKLEELKKHDEYKNGKLDSSLKALKTRAESFESLNERPKLRQDLMKWCKNSYERGWGARNIIWPLAKLYCSKEEVQS